MTDLFHVWCWRCDALFAATEGQLRRIARRYKNHTICHHCQGEEQ